MFVVWLITFHLSQEAEGSLENSYSSIGGSIDSYAQVGVAGTRISFTPAKGNKGALFGGMDNLLDNTPETPMQNRSASILSQHELLKVYMNNQLDLNEQEGQHYEEILVDIAERLQGALADIKAKDEQCQSLQKRVINTEEKLQMEMSSAIEKESQLTNQLLELHAELEVAEQVLRRCPPQ